MRHQALSSQTIPFRYTSKARLTLIPNDESNTDREVALKWDS